MLFPLMVYYYYDTTKCATTIFFQLSFISRLKTKIEKEQLNIYIYIYVLKCHFSNLENKVIFQSLVLQKGVNYRGQKIKSKFEETIFERMQFLKRDNFGRLNFLHNILGNGKKIALVSYYYYNRFIQETDYACVYITIVIHSLHF